MKRISIIFCLLIVHVSYGSNGCNGSLKGLDLANEFIAVCKFVNLIKFKENKSTEFILEVSVLEQLKGKLEKPILQIQLGSYASESLKTNLDNSKLLLFFRLENDNLQSYYLSDICRIIQLGENSQALLDRTKEIIRINQIKNFKKHKNKLVEWSIKCLDHNTTLNHGLGELSRKGILYQHNNSSFIQKRRHHIKRKHKKELLEFFLNKENFGYNEVFILGLIEKGNKSKVLSKMQDELNKYDTSKNPWFKEFNLMQEIARISQNDELKQLIEKIKEIGFYARSEEVKSLTIQFIEKLR